MRLDLDQNAAFSNGNYSAKVYRKTEEVILTLQEFVWQNITGYTALYSTIIDGNARRYHIVLDEVDDGHMRQAVRKE